MVGVLNPIPYKGIFCANDQRVIQAGDPIFRGNSSLIIFATSRHTIKIDTIEGKTSLTPLQQPRQGNRSEIEQMDNQPDEQKDDQPVSPRSLIKNPPRVDRKSVV